MDFSLQCDGKIHISGTKNVHIGTGCRIGRDTELRTIGNGCIRIGDDVRLNRSCTIVSYSEILIHDLVIIGEFVSIRDANHGMLPSEPMRYQSHDTRPIKIGRDVWIGRGSIILPGVTVGNGAVIGANSVVTQDIPSFSIAAGAPAKILKKRD